MPLVGESVEIRQVRSDTDAPKTSSFGHEVSEEENSQVLQWNLEESMGGDLCKPEQ